MLVKLCLPFAVILWKLHFIAANHAFSGAKINVCENVADHIFLQDIEDCAKYIVCIDGQAKSQQCKLGLYFDARRQACTGAKQNCIQCPAERIINIPLLKTCDKYISCYYGQGLLKKCDKDRQFNVKSGKCDLTRNVDCVENCCSIYATDKHLIYLPSAASCAKYYICQAGQVKYETCDEGFYFSKECNCCDRSENVKCVIEDFSAPIENLEKKIFSIDFSKSKPTLVGETNKVKCPPKGHFLYQYIEDPVYYFTCVEGKATMYACPSEFQFDDKLKRCMHKKSAEPMNMKLDNDQKEEDNNELSISLSPESDIIAKLGNNDDEFSTINCPMYGKTTLPHAQSNQYYLCVEGEVAVIACAPGLFYDDNLKSCTTEYNSEIYSNHVNTDASIFMCPKLGTFVFPHIQKNRYYICIDGTALGFACAPGNVFDIITNTCKNEKYQAVTSDNQKPQVLDEAVDILCPPFGAMKLVHEQKHKFYLCVNGIASVLACAEGSFFEPQAGVCRRTFDLMKASITAPEHNSAELSPIDEESSIECPILGTFIYPHIEKNLYFVCLDGSPVTLSCPQGLIFDNNKKICSAGIKIENVVDQTGTFETGDGNV